MNRALLALALASLLAGAAHAQPRIHVETPVWEFGSMDQNQTVKHTFQVRNAGTQPLDIRDINTSCGCTAAEPSTRRIAPGAEATLAVTLDLKGRRGAQDYRIVVHTNDPDQPATQISITGTVTAEIIADPAGLFFGQLLLGSREERTVEIRADRQARDFEITGVTLEDGAPLETVVVPVREGRNYKITVRTVPPLPEGPLSQSLRIRTTSPTAPEVRVDVFGYVVGKLMIAPTDLRLIPVPGAAPVARYILIRPGTVTEFKVTQVDVPDPDMKAQIHPSSGGYRVRVSDIRVRPELAGQAIVIHTDVEGYERISIPISMLDPASPDAP